MRSRQGAAGMTGWVRHRDGQAFSLTVEVPAATEIHLPDGARYKLAGGRQTYTCQLP